MGFSFGLIAIVIVPAGYGLAIAFYFVQELLQNLAKWLGK